MIPIIWGVVKINNAALDIKCRKCGHKFTDDTSIWNLPEKCPVCGTPTD